MKIAVMGAGALGLYFGGRIAAAWQQSGAGEVAFVARGANLEALRRDGLRIRSPMGDLHLAPVTATGDPAEIGPVDLVLFLVKLYDTEAAARAMAPLLGPDTAIVSFQNGVDGWERIGAIAGPGRVIGGIARIPADLRAPGLVSHNGPFHTLVFGEFDGTETARCRALRDALQAGGVDAHLVPDIQVKIWEKFILLSTLSALTALTRLPIGRIRRDPAAAVLVERAIAEAAAVGRARCADLPADAEARAAATIAGLPEGMRASMLDDLERGKPLELQSLSGTVARLAAAHGIAAPTHDLVARALYPYAQGAPSQAPARAPAQAPSEAPS